jgi:hypothetical protein
MIRASLTPEEGRTEHSPQALRREVKDIWAGQALKTVWDLLREYKIPANHSNGDADFEVRLIHLVLALTATHPKHKKRARPGPKTKWGAFEKAALLSEVSQLQREGRQSGKRIALTAACKEIAGRKPWQSFLEDAHNPSETLRQMYNESKSDTSLDSFVRFFAEAAKSGEEDRRRRIALMLRKSLPKRPSLEGSLDQLLHGKL